jgi:4-amino-4-deoxy-L-arabinose transferase-like glycosyltransferase
LIDRDEPRFAEAAREMIERGDYVVPFFNNQYRFDKPPLTYWCQTLSYCVFGENDFAARFPSAVAAALIAVLLLAWGRRLESERAGWWAAIIFTLCLQTFIHAKAAVADMWLTLFVTAAHWAGYELLRDRLAKSRDQPSTTRHAEAGRRRINHQPSPAWWWTFYLALAFAFLAKGPIGWTPLLTLIAMKLMLRNLRLADRLAPLTGMILMLGVVALWAIPALLRTHGEFFRVGIGRHVIERSLVTMEGHGSKSLGWYVLTLPFYFATVFISFFPWSIKLPWLTRGLCRNSNAAVGDHGYNGRDATDNYLITGSAIIFLIFSLLKTKLPHYTLPAFPLLALLLARHWSRLEMADINFKRIAVASVAVWLAVALFVFPFTRRYSPALQLLEASCNDLRAEMEFGAVDYNEPSLVWYFRSRVRGFSKSALDSSNVRAFMEKPGARFVIVPAPLAEKIYPQLPTTWKSFSTRGFNVAKGKRVDLTLILKPGEP